MPNSWSEQRAILTAYGYSVYVDWIDDPQLDRSRVTQQTAAKLRDRMLSCRSLFYLTTSNADSSKWMPWECGFFDGAREKAAILPVKDSSDYNVYVGQEYLGLYPYVGRDKNRAGDDKLWINRTPSTYLAYDVWVATPNAELEWRND
jgi:hypothetical protein